MAQEALDKCEVPPFVDDQYPSNSNSKIFNAMIHPLIRMSIKGVLWYQGMQYYTTLEFWYISIILNLIR